LLHPPRIFLEDEAKIINSIPISPLPVEDRIIWRGTTNGNFSVRSAYFLEVEKNEAQRGETSRPVKGILWKECWNMKVPNVVKLFLWKALHNLLPTRVNLAKKGVITDTLCPICAMDEETVLHVLWSCPASVDVWGAGPRRLQKIGGVGICFSELFDDICRRCDISELELFAVTARRIWLRRNSAIHGEQFSHPTRLLDDAQTSLNDFQRIHNSGNTGETTARELEAVMWRPPPSHKVKLNWDAGVNAKEGRVGLGLIIRDSVGNCIAARSMSMDLQTDATTAEAYAAIHALIFCKELGHTNIILEGDAMNVIKAIEAEGPCLSNYGHLIECIKRELQQLENASFIHVLRDANNAAHSLAKLATTHVTMSTWLGDVPPSIGDIVRRDKSLLLV
jgi:ribonuclease HI